MYPSIHWGVCPSAYWDTPLPCEQTPVKILPCRNFVVDSKKSLKLKEILKERPPKGHVTNVDFDRKEYISRQKISDNKSIMFRNGQVELALSRVHT